MNDSPTAIGRMETDDGDDEVAPSANYSVSFITSDTGNKSFIHVLLVKGLG